MKRTVACILILTLLMSICHGFTLKANAESEFPEEYTAGYLTYIIEDGKAIVYYCSYEASGHIGFPATFMGCPVTTIDEYAFAWCEYITAVTIPASVTTIEEGAFDGCTALTQVYYTGTQAQWNEISIAADNECLTGADISFGAPETPEYPDDPGVPPIPEENEYTYTVENGNVTITGYTGTFEGDVIFPDELEGYPVTAIGELAFADCDGLTYIMIPGSVQTVGRAAFDGCNSLEAVDLEYGVEIIEQGAFSDSAVSFVSIPDSVTTIGDYAFASSNLSYVVLPDSITVMGDSVFSECKALTEAILPNGITTISYGTFRSCTELESVTIPDSVEIIEKFAFSSCTKLESVTLKTGVTLIEECAFARCSELSSVIIPLSVTTIEKDAFGECSQLTDVYYEGTEEQWAEISIGIRNDQLTDATIHYEFEIPEEEVPEEPEIPGDMEIPDPLPYLTYTVKGDGVKISKCDISFSGILMVPEEIEGYPVTEIAYWAFTNCYGISLVVIPDTVTTVGGGAFQNCTGLLGAYVGEGTEQIMESAFEGCESMVTVFLPASLESIDDNAFENCPQLSAVYYSGNRAQWEQIAIGSGNEALMNAEILYEWNVVEEPEEYVDGYLTYIFRGEEAIVYYCDMEASGSVVIRDTVEGCPVTAIDEYSFTACEYITSVTIPLGITAIGEAAFDGCTALTDVYYAGTAEDWENIVISSGNDPLLNATIHYGQTTEKIGDLDGNETVDEDDVIYLLQHLLMPDDFPVEQPVDYDHNDRIDEDDVIYLLQHLLMPEDFPL